MSQYFQGRTQRNGRKHVRNLLQKKRAASLLLPVAGAALLFTASPSFAAQVEVNGTTSLADAIATINGSSDSTNSITFASGYENITLTDDLPPITNNVDIVGGPNVVINGGGSYRGFSVGDGGTDVIVNINDITIEHTNAQGGAGSDGGGGGAGLGGALFVNSHATVNVTNVIFDSNEATGGAGGDPSSNNAGGGGGMTGDAPSGDTEQAGGGPGGGAGAYANGDGATANAGGGSDEGGGGGGAYADASSDDGDASASATGGDGGFGGGGGAALADADGGQAAAVANGGKGGYGGGGGGASAHTLSGNGEPVTNPGEGGYGGGDGSDGGGGGAGFGGAIFVRKGGTLNINGGTSIDNSNVTGGAGAGNGAAGSAAGNGIFLNGNTLGFNIDQGLIAEMSDDIADSSDVTETSETGAGSITKSGEGTLILSGTNTYTGTTSVDEGTLQQDGTAESKFIVNAILNGTGTIHNLATINSGGALKGGNSTDLTGTLTIDNLTFNSGSNYEVYLTDSGSNSNVVVNNTADLGGAQVLLADGSTFTLGTEYTILSAGTRTGSFADGVDTGNAVLVGALSYRNQDVILQIVTDFGGQDGTINEESMSDYLDDIADNDDLPDEIKDKITGLAEEVGGAGSLAPLDPYLGDVYSAFDQLGYWQSSRFINRLTEHLNTDQSAADWARSFAFNGANGLSGVGSQMNLLRQLVAAQPSRLAANDDLWSGAAGRNASGVWGAIYGDRLDTDTDSALGSPEWDASTKGVTLGYGISKDGLNYGVAIGYHDANLDFANRAADGDSDGWDIGLYAGKESNSWYYNGALSFTTNSNNLTRTDGSGEYESDFHSRSFAAMVEAGRHFALGQNENRGVTTATPYLSLVAMHYNRGSVSESGPGVGLDVDSGSHTFLTSTLGARIDHKIVNKAGNTKGGLMAGLSWIHQFGDTAMDVGVALQGAGPASFKVWGTPLSKNALGLDLGGYGKFSQNLLGFLNYHGSFGGNEKLHSITAGLEFRF